MQPEESSTDGQTVLLKQLSCPIEEEQQLRSSQGSKNCLNPLTQADELSTVYASGLNFKETEYGQHEFSKTR